MSTSTRLPARTICWRIGMPHGRRRTTKSVSRPESDSPVIDAAHSCAAGVVQRTLRRLSGESRSMRAADSQIVSAASRGAHAATCVQGVLDRLDEHAWPGRDDRPVPVRNHAHRRAGVRRNTDVDGRSHIAGHPPAPMLGRRNARDDTSHPRGDQERRGRGRGRYPVTTDPQDQAGGHGCSEDSG